MGALLPLEVALRRHRLRLQDAGRNRHAPHQFRSFRLHPGTAGNALSRHRQPVTPRQRGRYPVCPYLIPRLFRGAPHMALSHVVRYPRIGARRELKRATEGYWDGKVSRAELEETARTLRLEAWRRMQEAGIDLIPSNTFSFYDQVLDTTAMVGAVPSRYQQDLAQ